MGPGRTPAVHRCPKGKAVGDPKQTTSDERPSDNDMPRTNVHTGKQVQTDVLSAKTGVDRHLYTYKQGVLARGAFPSLVFPVRKGAVEWHLRRRLPIIIGISLTCRHVVTSS